MGKLLRESILTKANQKNISNRNALSIFFLLWFLFSRHNAHKRQKRQRQRLFF